MRDTNPNRHGVAGCCLLLVAALTGGCTTQASVPASPPPSGLAAEFEHPAGWPPEPDVIPVMRYGRYTLVELAPSLAQRDLLRQVVNVSIPQKQSATVGDALGHILKRSGYQLCSGSDVPALHGLPLPAPHHRLGPIILRDALLTLAGPAWDLVVDDGARRVCFVRVAPPVPDPIDVATLRDPDTQPPPAASAIIRKSLP
ncbi:PilL N-terminal domain-containing protein [Xanthobacter autotrophicus]|uniref:PFGI-1 class ICE element type IV pilus protein PilL2 n=1 Tax=Xanthobacter autotrophicus TaxID=280 RepID=UPI00372A4B94